jgi:hypothetical protein
MPESEQYLDMIDHHLQGCMAARDAARARERVAIEEGRVDAALASATAADQCTARIDALLDARTKVLAHKGGGPLYGYPYEGTPPVKRGGPTEGGTPVEGPAPTEGATS